MRKMYLLERPDHEPLLMKDSTVEWYERIRKSPSARGILTHKLLILRQVLFRCAGLLRYFLKDVLHK